MNTFEQMKMKENAIPVEELRRHFDYDGENLIWKMPTSNRVKRGSVAGSMTVSGYLQVGLFGMDIKVHRIIWAISHGEWPSLLVDHKDGNPLNNKMENLMEASFNENVRNMKKPRHNTSGVKGVGYCKQTGMWTCWIWVNNKKIWLGRHASKEGAARAYALASKKYHKQFGRLK